MHGFMIFDQVLIVFIGVGAEDRNNLEKLTLAVLTHLPTAVLYVHDLTGECGTSPSDQVIICLWLQCINVHMVILFEMI